MAKSQPLRQMMEALVAPPGVKRLTGTIESAGMPRGLTRRPPKRSVERQPLSARSSGRVETTDAVQRRPAKEATTVETTPWYAS